MARKRRQKTTRRVTDFAHLSGKMNIAYHALAYFDLLGQSNALSAIDQPIMTSDPPRPDSPFAQAIRAALGPIHTFRTTLAQYFESFLDRTGKSPPPEFDSWGTAQRQLWNQVDARPPLRFQGFSDTVLVFASLENLPTASQLATLEALVAACAAIMPTALALGVVPRGAVDIATGIEMYQGEIYGPVLLRCHHLESKCADWPRVVVGDGVSEFLDACAPPTAESPERAVVAALATDLRKWIKRDSRGTEYVDFLGKQAWLSVLHNQKEILQDAYTTTRTLASKYVSDPKISPKYLQLLSYFENSAAFKLELSAPRTAG